MPAAKKSSNPLANAFKDDEDLQPCSYARPKGGQWAKAHYRGDFPCRCELAYPVQSENFHAGG